MTNSYRVFMTNTMPTLSPGQANRFIKTFANSRLANRAQDISPYQVWQEGSHPEAIFSKNFARQKIDCIHMNPVRAGMVKTADEWPFSSARAYLLGEETYPPTDLLVVGELCVQLYQPARFAKQIELLVDLCYPGSCSAGTCRRALFTSSPTAGGT